MLNKTLTAFTPALIAAMALTGCQYLPGQGERLDSPARVAGAEPVTIHEQTHGSDDALDEPALYLIESQQALDELGAGSLDELDVNFDDHAVVLVALGEQPTGGYWAHIEAVQLVDNEIWAQTVFNQPDEDEAATQAITYPFAAAVIDRVEGRLHHDPREVRGQSRPE